MVKLIVWVLDILFGLASLSVALEAGAFKYLIVVGDIKIWRIK